MPRSSDQRLLVARELLRERYTEPLTLLTTDDVHATYAELSKKA